jgi:hypothetical protein
MELPSNLVHATLTEITWDKDQKVSVVQGGVSLEVQFNPETLKLSYSNQRSGNDQRGGAATQHVGEGTTKLSFDLWFDVDAPPPSMVSSSDVRDLTQQVVYFITSKPSTDKKTISAPGVRFSWGSFLFEGTVESLNENLELFSEDGRPLRAQVSVSLSKQQILVDLSNAGSFLGGQVPPGTQQIETAAEGDTLQDIAQSRGIDDWQSIARINGIEQPRLPAPGLAIRFQ